MICINLPKSVSICEVGLRDGLQNEKALLSTEQKLTLLNMVEDSGIRVIEIGSLVKPKAVPAQADTDEVFRRCRKRPGVEYRALIMNMQGLLRAEEAGIGKAKMIVSASRTHCLKNQNRTPEQVIAGLRELKEAADDKGIVMSGAIATAFGCPFEGKIEMDSILPIVEAYVKMGICELSLSDTTGMADPALVYERCRTVQEMFPEVVWNLHFHNTRGLGLANVLAGMEAGVSRFDASFGGLGGCPFAPGATGNIATEDLLHMLLLMGIDTYIDIDRAIATAKKVQEFVGHETASFILKAGKNSDLYRKNCVQ